MTQQTGKRVEPAGGRADADNGPAIGGIGFRCNITRLGFWHALSSPAYASRRRHSRTAKDGVVCPYFALKERQAMNIFQTILQAQGRAIRETPSVGR